MTEYTPPANAEHEDYLPYAQSDKMPCAAASPINHPDGMPWLCSRKRGHDGDHAAHGSDLPPSMLARWGEAEEAA